MNTNTLVIIVAAFAVLITLVAAGTARRRYRHEFIVNEGYAGLLYHDGRLAQTLTAGRHVRWGRNFRLAWVDLRKALVTVPGQEVLSADNVGVKISLVLAIQITDAAKSVEADNYLTHLYSAAQTATREVVAGVTLDALLAQRSAIGAQLRELVAPRAETLGVQLQTVEVRDVMLPGELRKAFSEVLKAKQEGLAALERARAESAALRNLANAARLIEGQPSLTTLRLLQTLEAANQTIVLNDLSVLGLTARGKETN